LPCGSPEKKSSSRFDTRLENRYDICDMKMPISNVSAKSVPSAAPPGFRAICTPQSKTQRSAFTLVELLVVIGILGVLAAILFPTISRSLERGKRITCVNNLRQMGSGALLIVQSDFPFSEPGEFLFASDADDLANAQLQGWKYTWFGLIANELGMANRLIGETDAITLEPEKPPLFFCPSADRSISGWTKENFSYGYNFHLGSIWKFRLSMVDSFASTPGMISDSRGDGNADGKSDYVIQVSNATSGNPRPPGTRHEGGSNVVFVDGRVEWQNFSNLVRKGGPFHVLSSSP